MYYSLDTEAKRVMTWQMKHCGFSASIMRAKRLPNTGRHHLPPGSQIPVFPVDALPGCPPEWIRGGSFVCPVDADWGIWFDWTSNDQRNTAVIPSVKGMNPITGRRMEGPHMESYEEKCPTHGTPFGNGLFCEKCGYAWPPQNYLTDDSGPLWWDGFRQPDGTVRQFFFTEDEKRDIASLVIGKESTVPAFGFVFYDPLTKRLEPAARIDQIVWKSSYPFFVTYVDGCWTAANPTWDKSTYVTCDDAIQSSVSSCCTGENIIADDGAPRPAANVYCASGLRSMSQLEARDVRPEVSVGAGAEIMQEVAKDSLGIDGWKSGPSSVIRLYFCFREQFERIVEGGIVDPPSQSGFLSNLPVG